MKRVSGMAATSAGWSADTADAVAGACPHPLSDEELLSRHCGPGPRVSVLKDSPAEELIRAVRLVAAGEAVLDPVVTGRVLDAYRSSSLRRAAMARPRWIGSPPASGRYWS